MFVHELWKNADPSRLALDGNRALTYAAWVPAIILCN